MWAQDVCTAISIPDFFKTSCPGGIEILIEWLRIPTNFYRVEKIENVQLFQLWIYQCFLWLREIQKVIFSTGIFDLVPKRK